MTWFTRFDYWADNHKIPQRKRYVKITTDLLNDDQSDRLLFHNDGISTTERV